MCYRVWLCISSVSPQPPGNLWHQLLFLLHNLICPPFFMNLQRQLLTCESHCSLSTLPYRFSHLQAGSLYHLGLAMLNSLFSKTIIFCCSLLKKKLAAFYNFNSLPAVFSICQKPSLFHSQSTLGHIEIQSRAVKTLLSMACILHKQLLRFLKCYYCFNRALNVIVNLLHSNSTWFLGDAANCTVLVLHRSAWRRWSDTRDGDGEMTNRWALCAAAVTKWREEEQDGSAAAFLLCSHKATQKKTPLSLSSLVSQLGRTLSQSA